MYLLLSYDLSHITVKQRIINSDLSKEMMVYYLRKWVKDHKYNIFYETGNYLKKNKDKLIHPLKFSLAQIRMRLEYNKINIDNIVVDKDKLEVKFQIVFNEGKSK